MQNPENPSIRLENQDDQPDTAHIERSVPEVLNESEHQHDQHDFERCPITYKKLNELLSSSEVHQVDYIDFTSSDIGENDLVYVVGQHPSARYLIRKLGNHALIWNSLDATPLTKPLENFKSSQPHTNPDGGLSYTAEKGYRVGNSFGMPYFRYEKVGDRLVTQTPDVGWGDNIVRLIIIPHTVL